MFWVATDDQDDDETQGLSLSMATNNDGRKKRLDARICRAGEMTWDLVYAMMMLCAFLLMTSRDSGVRGMNSWGGTINKNNGGVDDDVYSEIINEKSLYPETLMENP